MNRRDFITLLGGTAAAWPLAAAAQQPTKVAPARLSPAEAETWRAAVGSRPAGHFGPEVFPVLQAYCVTAAACDYIASRLRVEEGVDHAMLETYDRMTHSLMSLAEALDLLPGGAKRAGPP